MSRNDDLFAPHDHDEHHAAVRDSTHRQQMKREDGFSDFSGYIARRDIVGPEAADSETLDRYKGYEEGR